MKMKHTKGKLTVSKTAHHRLESESGMVIADAWSDPDMSIEQSLANAERLALAWNLLPEFIETLQAVSRLDYFQEHGALADKVRAILAKATSAE